jgi:ubiquinone/menaquinone biosynthesis C-methylase UbiE
MKPSTTPAENGAAWEEAYQRFETPAEEIDKFRRRLSAFGVKGWPRDAKIVELFCGRGNGLRAWKTFGFADLTGIDLSSSLVGQVDPGFNTIVADARSIPLPDDSVDVISIHGGLHHLFKLPEDLRAVLLECRRVLKAGGRLLIVEPWLTPFLRFVHWCCRRRFLRALRPRLDALATMIELEADTYFNWLRQPDVVLGVLREIVPPDIVRISFGKLSYLARRGNPGRAGSPVQ